MAFLLACWPAGWSNHRVRQLLAGATAAGLVGAASGLLLQAPFDAGTGLAGIGDPRWVRPLVRSRFGHAHLVRLAVLLVLALVLTHAARPPARAAKAALGCLAASMLVTIAVEGHAAVGGSAPLRITLDVAHLAAAAVWLGGLTALTVAAVPAFRAGLGGGPPGRTLRRFSAVALTCVAVLVSTGVVQAWRQVGELSALTATSYGRLLIAKVGLLSVVLAVAAVSRSLVHRRSLTGNQVGLLWRSVGTEAAVGASIVAVTAVLVATTPARAAYRPVEARSLRAGPVTVELSAVPTGPRGLSLHVYTLGADGLPADVPELMVRARAPKPAPRPGGHAAPARRSGPFRRRPPAPAAHRLMAGAGLRPTGRDRLLHRHHYVDRPLGDPA